MKKFFTRMSWKFYHFRWAVAKRFVPEFAIKFNRGIFRFSTNYGFGWMDLPDWEELEKQLQCCFDEQAGMALKRLDEQKEAYRGLFRVQQAGAWRSVDDNRLPQAGPTEVTLSDGTVFLQEHTL